QELCPLCGEGHVSTHSEMVENEYKGQKAMLPLMFKQCDACGSDFAGAAESKLNRRSLMAWRKQIDGLLTGEEITALRKQYKLTQEQAARLFGGGPVAFSKYENDDVSQSEAMDTLLRLVRRSHESFWALVDEKNMRAEFTQTKTMVQMQTSNVVALVRRNGDANASIYNPREFRRVTPGELACNP
ncbi:MAG: type II toxin-antitoxin system MqsA family antitoxin, partial [Brachymonas sp.]